MTDKERKKCGSVTITKGVAIININLSVFLAASGGMLVEHSNTLFKNTAIETEIILTGLLGAGLVFLALACATMASLVLHEQCE